MRIGLFVVVDMICHSLGQDLTWLIMVPRLLKHLVQGLSMMFPEMFNQYKEVGRIDQ